VKLSKILCLDYDGSELPGKFWEQIDSLVEERVLGTEREIKTHSNTDALLVKLGAKVPPKLIDELPSLKYVGMLGTGYGGIDTQYASSKGITVTNIADYATEAVAEFTLGVLLEYYRDIGKARNQAKSGDYSDNFSGGEVKGKKFGVIGLGDIGLRTAELAKAFGADVRYWSRNRKVHAEDNGIIFNELDQLISESDIITVNLAYNSDTEGIFNEKRITKIKQHCILINPSPMELFDWDALHNRLKKEDIVFILDHSDEMTDEQLSKLKPLENTIVYPPIGYMTAEANEAKYKIFVDNLTNYLSDMPSNQVN
jgi:phosphoglycerate dehydrogenase-like enzyme